MSSIAETTPLLSAPNSDTSNASSSRISETDCKVREVMKSEGKKSLEAAPKKFKFTTYKDFYKKDNSDVIRNPLGEWEKIQKK